MSFPKISIVAAVAALGLLTACASTGPAAEPGTSSGPDTAASAGQEPATGGGAVVGTVVRFTSDDARVDVTIGEDSPAVRDFLSMLPLTLDVEELGGREKIVYLPRELDIEGSPGSDPEDGDLIYFTPWGNLGFYYDASGIEHSDQTLHLGTYDATRDELDALQGADVTIEMVDR